MAAALVAIPLAMIPLVGLLLSQSRRPSYGSTGRGTAMGGPSVIIDGPAIRSLSRKKQKQQPKGGKDDGGLITEIPVLVDVPVGVGAKRRTTSKKAKEASSKASSSLTKASSDASDDALSKASPDASSDASSKSSSEAFSKTSSSSRTTSTLTNSSSLTKSSSKSSSKLSSKSSSKLSSKSSSKASSKASPPLAKASSKASPPLALAKEASSEKTPVVAEMLCTMYADRFNHLVILDGDPDMSECLLAGLEHMRPLADATVLDNAIKTLTDMDWWDNCLSYRFMQENKIHLIEHMHIAFAFMLYDIDQIVREYANNMGVTLPHDPFDKWSGMPQVEFIEAVAAFVQVNITKGLCKVSASSECNDVMDAVKKLISRNLQDPEVAYQEYKTRHGFVPLTTTNPKDLMNSNKHAFYLLIEPMPEVLRMLYVSSFGKSELESLLDILTSMMDAFLHLIFVAQLLEDAGLVAHLESLRERASMMSKDELNPDDSDLVDSIRHMLALTTIIFEHIGQEVMETDPDMPADCTVPCLVNLYAKSVIDALKDRIRGGRLDSVRLIDIVAISDSPHFDASARDLLVRVCQGISTDLLEG